MAFSNRMQSHYTDIKNGEFIFGNSPINKYFWVPVKYSNNYVTIYAKFNTINSEIEQILTFYTQQEIRSLEQAYSSYVKPSNYKGAHVNMWHTDWTPNVDFSYMSTGKQISWITKTGETHTQSSISSATTELGFSVNRIKAVAKVNNTKLNTEKYGPVTV